ncbi:LytTR family two component transcriptional regulator [Gelidibacter algens]|uniref:LytTR family two component transcriptional regulator n=1 Tax=Gelidibacter algens TaxID=49280 RepID=A0A1A7QKI8_9FLAO|nr:LytTR family DNA-binding domain-containing protein [Gelidibacter algens]OBX19704.1 hypothetical protein A9996_18790 [Gelidibacter algens]RAJ25086.1 LytTR family two component transcriptional regulator [Gelidibacter algens]
MIKIAIIEDEIPARNKLKRFLIEQEEKTEVVVEIDTIRMAVEFLKNTKVDLIISDIELLDGNAFEIYSNVSVSCPIIFTTAYNQFWMNAFETNGIEYLLKPFSKERFQKAWNKFLLLSKSEGTNNDLLSQINFIVERNLTNPSYKERFTISNHQEIYFLDMDSIIFFEADEGVIFAYDNLGKKHLLNETTLKEIEVVLNPKEFFRINRSELVNKKYIQKIERYSKNALILKIVGCKNYLKTSQSNTVSFREWIEK